MKRGQNLFNTLQDVCNFIALEDDMDQIVRAVEKDNEEVEELREALELAIKKLSKYEMVESFSKQLKNNDADTF